MESRQQRRARERAEAKATRARSEPGVVTEQDLVDGVQPEPDITIRLATGADVDAIAPLVELTGVPLDDYIEAALREDKLAGALRTGLRDGIEALQRDVATEAVRSDGDLRSLYLRSALPLVAETDSGVVGTLLAYPPVQVIHRYYTAAAAAGPAEQQKTALGGAISLIKIKAVAVAEQARGRNIGSALLRCCTRVYRQCRFVLLYGQIPAERDLEAFYRRQGFEVKAPGECLDLWVVFGRAGGVHADAGERLFARWL